MGGRRVVVPDRFVAVEKSHAVRCLGPIRAAGDAAPTLDPPGLAESHENAARHPGLVLTPLAIQPLVVGRFWFKASGQHVCAATAKRQFLAIVGGSPFVTQMVALMKGVKMAWIYDARPRNHLDSPWRRGVQTDPLRVLRRVRLRGGRPVREGSRTGPLLFGRRVSRQEFGSTDV